MCLRALGRDDDATRLLRETLRTDPHDQLARTLDGRDPEDPFERIDVVLDLASFGEAAEAERLLASVLHGAPAPEGAGSAAAIAGYLLGHVLERRGLADEAALARRDAAAADAVRAFPVGLDAHDALTAAIAADPSDLRARSLLGMLLYDAGRRNEAAEQWRRVIEGGSTDAITHRNAGLSACNDAHDDDAAWASYLRARELAPDDARILYELDQLAARLGHEDRLDRLDRELPLVLSRDDLTVGDAEPLTSAGRAAETLSLLDSRRFQPWEGGEGRALAAWDAARTALGLPLGTPPASLREARPEFTAPAAVREDGSTDDFATSLPELLLFHRE